MSYFEVTIEKIETISDIDGADRIQKATLLGLPFVFVIGKDSFSVGEDVVYFPIDSLLPHQLSEKLGVCGKLSGKDKNRVKTIKLKNIYSQGIVGKISLISEFLVQKFGKGGHQDKLHLVDFSELTNFFGVTKYEPPEIIEKGGKLMSKHVDGVPYYDIESTDRNCEVVSRLLDIPVLVTCKVEGSNHYCGITKDGEEVVGQRSGQIIQIPNTTHTWWEASKNMGFIEISKRIQKEIFPNCQIILRSEICGPKIQGNYYNLQKYNLFCFDIMVDDNYLSAKEFINITNRYNIQTVPIICYDKTLRNFLNGRSIEEASTFISKLVNKLAEGIVIKPMIEQYDEKLGGRLIIKKRSSKYLSKNEF